MTAEAEAMDDWMAEQREAFAAERADRWQAFIETDEIRALWEESEAEDWAQWLAEASDEPSAD